MWLSLAGTPLAQPECDAPRPIESRHNRSDRLFELWSAKLANPIRQAGDGDPAVLAQRPLMRTPASPRPTQIVFSVKDLDALIPGREGYDLTDVLLDKRGATAGIDRVFVVGAVRRKDSRPVAIVDIRLMRLSAHGSGLAWRVGAWGRRRGAARRMRMRMHWHATNRTATRAKPCAFLAHKIASNRSSTSPAAVYRSSAPARAGALRSRRAVSPGRAAASRSASGSAGAPRA